jgi:isoaspartyl peptidase/L-asparaginase-like protein (Ntn-hydrolase superfamily)
MQRRDFLKRGLFAWTALRSLSTTASAAEEAAGPWVISTWSFGLAANKRTHRRLLEGARPLDAAIDGAKLSEADPRIDSVGYGGLPNVDGVVELDAAVMDGNTLDAGAVAGLRGIKHPVAVARKVMDESAHVLLVGEGAQRFALRHGFKKEKLLTDEAKRQWKEGLATGGKPRGHDTLGLIAMSRSGEMAAVCTTSGLALKLPGRVGDSPLIGDGLYCDGRVGGAVATGLGEEVIKVCGSYQVVEFMRQGLPPDEAVRRVLQRIADRNRGKREMPFVGMAALRADGAVGFASTTPPFQAAVSRGGSHELLDTPSLLPATDRR